MIRRICFDIQSSYFFDSRNGWLEGPNEARQYFKDKTFRFWAATAFDDSNGRYIDFTNYKELFAYLVDADEIITFNGRKCDLVVLENLAGEESARVIWGKPHHDLTGWRQYWRPREAAKYLLPDMASRFESTVTERRVELGSTDLDDRRLDDLAGTYRDVSFTYALFVEYLKSGDSDRTFPCDLENLIPKELL